LARRTVGRLRAQSLRDRMELVLVAVSGPIEAPAAELAGFWGAKIVPAPGAAIPQGNAAGVRAAASEVVVFAEDHCFPEPGWAAALVSAHAAGHAAVGPEVANANPGSIISRCDYMIGFGPWMSPCRGGLVPFLPGHNSSYKREALLAYGDRLPAMLESETVLHYDLTRRGRTLYLEPAARARHVNFATWGAWLRVQYYCGRVFAGSRARPWGFGRRLFYGAAAPLIPLVRAARICGELSKPGRRLRSIPALLPVMMVGLAVSGFGELMGYLAGPGRSADNMAEYEHDRLRFVRPADRRALESTR
jgi:hypothetical protein